MASNPLKYANVWEDAYLLGQALEVGSQDKVMSICSGGDNALYLLSYNPEVLLCLDTNPVQIYLCQLKEQAIRRLDRETCLGFLGFLPNGQRKNTYRSIRKNLSLPCQEFFDQHIDWVESGIIQQGKFEKYFQLFSGKILPFIHSKEVVNAVFTPKSEQEQVSFYENRWNTWRWRLFFKLFFSRFIMGRLGREPEKLKEVDGHVGRMIFNRAEQHLSSVAAQQNYILEYALTGKYTNQLPPYTNETPYKRIQKWLQSNQIQYEEAYLDQCLASHSGFTRFNLSNIFEYMPPEVFDQNIEALRLHAAPNAQVCYWNLMVPRTIEKNMGFDRLPIDHIDLGFFYASFHKYICLS
ncbi:MAG: DUF3419 family protein [Bacteroidia bacterium]|nr:DUF3419 family protein [Bacteroidia bacterium]